MTDFLNDTVTFEGDVTAEGLLVANGGLVVGPGGGRLGDLDDFWPTITRVRVANQAERGEVVEWRENNDPISSTRPLMVWRANGSLTGVEESTIDGTNWYATSPAAGDVEMTLAAAAPYGWALMTGQVLAEAATNYPALWANASAALRVGSGLLIPDMRGRVPIGAGLGAGLTLRNLGDLLGAEGVVLTVDQLATHDHDGVTTGADRSLNHTHNQKNDHVAGANPTGSGVSFEIHGGTANTHESSTVMSRSDGNTGTSLNHLHGLDIETTGSGEPHPNMQPSLVLNFKVKL